MMRTLKRRLLLGIALVAVAAGATAAVVMAAQPNGTVHHHKGVAGPLVTAAGYLGLSRAQLRSELKSGKSLAAIANATPGKSQAGLLEALESADRRKLVVATTRLPQRALAQVNRAGGPLPRAATGARRNRPRPRMLSTAAGYLAISTAQLRLDLQSGRTLGQLANATSGKSASGLVEALLAAAKAALASQVTAGKLTQAQANQILPQLSARLTARVDHPRRRHAGATKHAGATNSAP
jgi:hypothetical protein